MALRRRIAARPARTRRSSPLGWGRARPSATATSTNLLVCERGAVYGPPCSLPQDGGVDPPPLRNGGREREGNRLLRPRFTSALVAERSSAGRRADYSLVARLSEYAERAGIGA